MPSTLQARVNAALMAYGRVGEDLVIAACGIDSTYGRSLGWKIAPHVVSGLVAGVLHVANQNTCSVVVFPFDRDDFFLASGARRSQTE